MAKCGHFKWRVLALLSEIILMGLDRGILERGYLYYLSDDGYCRLLSRTLTPVRMALR